MDNRKISLAITSHQEFEKLIASFIQVIDDERINDITIVDDCSDEEISLKITDWLEFDAPEGRIKLCQNTKHIGERLNQRMAVVMADSEWVLLANTDTVVTTSLIDIIYGYDWDNLKLMGYELYFVNRMEYLRTFNQNEQ